MATTSSATMNTSVSSNMVNKSLLTMDEEETNNDQNGPVDLVKRVKLEKEDLPQEKVMPEYDHSSDQLSLSSFFVRRRRRGRGRYAPFYIHGDYSSRSSINSNDILAEKSTSPSLPLKSIRGQFACPNCSLLFSNRDALAMHMMDSVRSQGCSGQPTSTRPTVRLPSPTAPIATSVAETTADLALQMSNACFPSISPLVSTAGRPGPSSSETPVLARSSSSNGINMTSASGLSDPYTCRLCGERSVSVDALAMHMMAHAHHEQLRQETKKKEETGGGTQFLSGPSKLAIAPLYFSALDFSNMQRAMNMAMSALNKSNAPVDKQLHLSTATPTTTSAVSNPELPPKCHSAPLTSQSLPTSVDEMPKQSCSNGNTPDGNESVRNPFRYNLSKNLGLNFTKMNTVSPKEEEDDESVIISASDREEEDVHLNNGKLDDEQEKSITEEVQFPFCYVCRHCRIAYEDRTIFCLHMGLHNVNNPWQCNMCGKVCSGRHEFASHSLHF